MELQVLGKEKIGKYEFTGIEGGFGEDKKAMTVKDIAQIHETSVKRINELINRNRKRFKNGVDIVDLKTSNFVVVLNDLGFSQNEINRSNNIYLLSERGYSKLLKILEDDTAWDIYDELVDNYFSMRQSIKKPLTAVEQIKLLPKAVVELDDRVTNLEENQVIPQPLYNALQHRISQRVSEIAFSYGGVNKKQRSELFKDINGGVKRIANVSARSMLREKHYQMVMDFVNAWEPSTATITIIQQTALNVGEPA
jgi:hypothetical protein